MGSVTSRNGLTSKSYIGFAAWVPVQHGYNISQINLGSNSISKLEIVSSLNLFNIAHFMYHFNYNSCLQKYAPKIYLGTVQSASANWNSELQTGQTNGLGDLPGGGEKSGSWHLFKISKNYLNFKIFLILEIIERYFCLGNLIIAAISNKSFS